MYIGVCMCIHTYHAYVHLWIYVISTYTYTVSLKSLRLSAQNRSNQSAQSFAQPCPNIPTSPVACKLKNQIAYQHHWSQLSKLFRMSDVPVSVNMLLSWLHIWSHQVDSGLWLRSCNLWDKRIVETGGETEEQKKKSKSLSALLMQCTILGELKSWARSMPKVKKKKKKR